jgi:hypothetical protein
MSDVILVLCVLCLIAFGIYLLVRARANHEPKELRRNWKDFDEKVKEDRAKGPYLSTHPRPPWDGSKSGER